MAKPIPVVLKAPQIPSSKDVREELQHRLDEAPVEHAAALLSVYELVGTLHASGTLDLLRGLFGTKDEIIGRVAAGLDSPQVIRGIRNLIALGQLLGSVDPKVFEDLRDAFAETAEKNIHNNGKPPSLWKIVKHADTENSLRALGVMVDFLYSFGRHLKPDGHDNGRSSC